MNTIELNEGKYKVSISNVISNACKNNISAYSTQGWITGINFNNSNTLEFNVSRNTGAATRNGQITLSVNGNSCANSGGIINIRQKKGSDTCSATINQTVETLAKTGVPADTEVGTCTFICDNLTITDYEFVTRYGSDSFKLKLVSIPSGNKQYFIKTVNYLPQNDSSILKTFALDLTHIPTGQQIGDTLWFSQDCMSCSDGCSGSNITYTPQTIALDPCGAESTGPLAYFSFSECDSSTVDASKLELVVSNNSWNDFYVSWNAGMNAGTIAAHSYERNINAKRSVIVWPRYDGVYAPGEGFTFEQEKCELVCNATIDQDIETLSKDGVPENVVLGTCTFICDTLVIGDYEFVRTSGDSSLTLKLVSTSSGTKQYLIETAAYLPRNETGGERAYSFDLTHTPTGQKIGSTLNFVQQYEHEPIPCTADDIVYDATPVALDWEGLSAGGARQKICEFTFNRCESVDKTKLGVSGEESWMNFEVEWDSVAGHANVYATHYDGYTSSKGAGNYRIWPEYDGEDAGGGEIKLSYLFDVNITQTIETLAKTGVPADTVVAECVFNNGNAVNLTNYEIVPKGGSSALKLGFVQRYSGTYSIVLTEALPQNTTTGAIQFGMIIKQTVLDQQVGETMWFTQN